MSLERNLTSKSYRIKVGVTIGDPSGIGPQITARALNKLKGSAEFTIIGDKWVFDKSHKSVGTGRDLSVISQKYNLIDLNNVSRKDFQFGKVKAEYGRASIEYLDKALELIRNKEIDCMVTCPISKEAINLAGYKYSGHTEYLSCRTNTKDIVMMLLNKNFKFSLLTRHIPLRDVALVLDKDKIYKNILITYNSLKKLFSIKNPRVVICGLNPHASDNGIIGNEENTIVKPVIERLRRENKNIDGPLSSDIAIFKLKEKYYDCAVAMYHDQALIPLKLLNGGTGVNITLGLDFIRTSPLHGTAFDIAAENSANPNSLIEAIKLAVKCAANQKND